jgi:hypothetical protein
MPIAKVQLPNGQIARFEVPEGTTPEQVMEFASTQGIGQAQPEQPQERTLGGAVSEGIGEVIPSGVELAKGIYHAVTNPNETLDSINNLLAGYLQKGVDKFGTEKFGITKAPENKEQYADLMNKYMTDRYGGEQEVLNTIATDPSGLAMDLSILLSGGGTAMAKVPGLAKVGQAVTKTGSAIDPIQNMIRAGKIGTNVVRAAGPGSRSLLGVTTGAGTRAVERAITGGEEFEAALKGTTTQSDIVRASEEAMRQFRDIRRAKYADDFSKIADSEVVLDITPLRASFEGSLNKFGVRRADGGKLDFTRSVLDGDPKAMEAMSFINEKLGMWGKEAGDLTPVGLDTLKRNFDNYFAETNGARAVIADARNQVKTLLAENVEGYGKMTSDYQKATDFIHEIEKTFSTGGTPDTIMRKLNQAVKDNFEMRGALLSSIDAELGTSLVDMIAGNQMSSWMAKNLVGRFAGMAAGGVLLGQGISPPVIGALMVSSPKAVATMLRTLGVPKRAIKKFMVERPKLKAQYEAIVKAAQGGEGIAAKGAAATVPAVRTEQSQGQYDTLIKQGAR